MKIFLWLLYLIPNIVVSMSAFVVAPIAVAFQRSNRLPRWARWYETEDNDIFGDAGHFARWFPWGGDPWKARGRFYGWMMATAWLWRNRAYYFGKHYLGAKVSPTFTAVHVKGNPLVSNRPYVPGLVIRTTDSGYWHLYWIKGWGKNRLVRVNIGWKLWGDTKHPNFGQYVVTINPWAKRG